MRKPYCLDRRHPAAVWGVVLAAAFLVEHAVMGVLPWLLPEPPSRFAEATLDALLLTAVLAPVVWWVVVRPLRELVRLRARFVTDLLARAEADRRRTAHDLHDGVGQSLSLLVSGLKTAHAAAAADPALADRCGRLLDLAQTALRDVRRVSHGLRPSALDDLGLVPALERLAADTRDHHPLDLTLDAAGLGGGRLAPEVETALFRITQEALANVVRHAGARAVRVTLRRAGESVVLEVADDGRGFRPGAAGPGGHLGVVGMRERAALVGGRCEVASAPGRGTRVRAVVPAGGCEWTDSD